MKKINKRAVQRHKLPAEYLRCGYVEAVGQSKSKESGAHSLEREKKNPENWGETPREKFAIFFFFFKNKTNKTFGRDIFFFLL